MLTLLPLLGMFLPLEFWLKVTNGNTGKFVHQHNIQIPAALELSIESYSLSFASSFEGHAIHALFLLFSFQVEILTLSRASSLPFLQICEGCQKIVILTWYSKSLKNDNNDHCFHFFFIIINIIMIIITVIVIVLTVTTFSFQSS